jgi:hypothetical protein
MKMHGQTGGGMRWSVAARGGGEGAIRLRGPATIGDEPVLLPSEVEYGNG